MIGRLRTRRSSRACARRAIILAKGNLGEYASGDRSTFGGDVQSLRYEPQRRTFRAADPVQRSLQIDDVRHREETGTVGAQSGVE
jgi:hypothetical protein